MLPTEETTPAPEEEVVKEEAPVVKMPAQNMKASSPEMEVFVKIDEGVFPEDVTMMVRQYSKEQTMQIAQELNEEVEVVDAIAVDITFYTFMNGKREEVQPLDPKGVHVQLTPLREMQGENFNVLHIDSNGEAETVNASVTKDGATFDSVGFSVYAIVGEDGKTTDEEEVRRTYIFYRPTKWPIENAETDYVEWTREAVKNGDILVEPGTPSLPDDPDTYFNGWYEDGSDTRMTFGSPITDIPTAMGSQDQEVKVYARYVDKYVATFFDEEGNVENEKVGGPGDEITMDVEIPDIEEKNLKLVAWATKEDPEDPKYEEYALTDTYTFVDDDINFYPVLKPVRKIQFFENSDTASFTAPIYVIPGETIPAVTKPTNPGYTFTGWYEDEECTQLFDMLTDGTKVMPEGTGDLQLYAGWEGEEVDFEVYIWGEVMDANGNPIPEGADGRYAVMVNFKDTLPAGTVVDRDKLAEIYQEHQAEIQAGLDVNYYVNATDFDSYSEVIKGDGSTILNIYFDLKTFTFTFHNASARNKWRVTDIIHTENGNPVGVGGGNDYTFTGKLGQNITDLWPTFSYTTSRTESPSYYSQYAVFGWRISPTQAGTDVQPGTSASNFITHRHTLSKDVIYKVNDVPQAITNYWPHGANNSTSTQLHAYYMEPIQEGKEYDPSLRRRSRNGIDYIEMPEFTDHFTYTNTNYSALKTIVGYRNNGWERESSGSATRYFYYLPEEYDIIFHNYNNETSVTGILYKEDISANASRVPSREETGLPDYYTFEGWYTDRQHTNRYTFTGDQATMPSHNLVLYAYWKPSTITLTFDAAGGTIQGESSITQEIEADSLATNPGTPVRENYEFIGWGVEGNPDDRIDFTQRRFSENTTIVAHWTAALDKYSIVYEDDQGHAVPTDTNQYRFGSEVILKKSPVSSETHHFHGWKIKGYGETVYLPGDTVVLNDPAMATNHVVTFLAYHGSEQQEHDLEDIVTITYHSNYPDGSAEVTELQDKNDAGEDLMRNAPVTAKGNIFTLAGYKLIGWNTAADGSGRQFNLSQMIFADHEGNNDLYAVWELAPDVEYKIEHYQQNLDDPTQYTVVSTDTETKIGTTGTTVTATPKDYDGFTFDPIKTGTQNTGEILADGSLILKVYYSRNSDYQLQYFYSGVTPEGATLPNPNPITGLAYQQEVLVDTTYEVGEEVNGYKFNGWTTTHDDLQITKNAEGKDVIIMPARNAELRGTWTALTTTPYKVEYYFENIDDENYQIDDTKTKNLTGTTNTVVRAPQDTFEGFTLNLEVEGTVKEGTILGNGGLVLKLYYDRNEYEVEYHYNTDATGQTDLPEKRTYKYKESVPFADDATAPGYHFTGWETTWVKKSESLTFEMPARKVIVSGGWIVDEDTPYTVRYHFQNIAGDDYVLDNSKTKTLHGKTDTEASAPEDTFDGFTLDKNIPGTVDRGIIAGDGSLVLDLYYNRNSYEVEYHYTSDVTGESPLPAKTSYKFEEVVPFADDATAPGYTFNGWETTWVKKSESATFTMPARDVNVNGSWTADSDTPYKVEYHFQNIDDDDFTIDDTKTKNLTGTTGTNVSAPKDTFQGFLLDTTVPGTVERGAITGDGNLVLKLFYRRNEYTVTYHYNNEIGDAPTLPADADYRFEKTVTFAENPTKAGYTFSGWETTWVKKSDSETFDMPARDVTVSGTWTRNNDTQYKVQYYFQDINDESKYDIDSSKTKTLTGMTDTTAYAPTDTFEGFTLDTTVPGTRESGTIVGDGSLVLKLYYNRNKYDVVYHYTSDVTGESDLPTIKQYKFEEEVDFEADATAPGYTFNGWETTWVKKSESSYFVMPARDVNVNGSWSAKSDTPYKVEYHFQNILDDNYSIDDTKTKNLTGTTGTNVSAPKDTFEGFTIDTSVEGTKESGTVTGSGDLVLRLYYNRNKYDVVYHYDNHAVGESPLPTTKQYKFEEQVDFEPAATAPGYTFSGWSTTFQPAGSTSFTMPARAVTVNGSWTANADTAYKIEYYFESLDDSTVFDIDPNETEDLTGTTNAHVSSATITLPSGGHAEKEFDGFTLDKSVRGTVAEGDILGNGGLTLKLYYTRNSYTVQYYYRSGTPVDGQSIEDIRRIAGAPYQVKYGATVTTLNQTQVPDVSGYNFEGWSIDTNLDGTEETVARGGTFEMPAGDVDIFGAFRADSHVKYTINHYLLNVGGDKDDPADYTKGLTETSYGTTGNIVYASPLESYTNNGYIYYDDLTSHAAGADPTIIGGSTVVEHDGSAVINIYYTRKEYKVTYQYTNTVPGASALPAEETHEFGSTVTLADDATAPGYTFSGWSTVLAGTSEEFTMPARDVVVSGSWTANADTAYKVEYYFQNITNNNYTIDNTKTKNLTGTTGTVANAPQDTFDGFTINLNATGTVRTGTITGDGKLVLKLYYDRNSYDVVYHYTNDVTGESALPTTVQRKYGATVSFAADATAPGYTFNGWETTWVKKSESATFVMPARTVTVNGGWTAKSDTPYKVEYHFQNILDDNYSIDDSKTKNLTGTTNTTVNAPKEVFEGFTLDTSVEGTKESGKVDGNGGLVLKLYYTRNKYKVTYQYTNDAPGQSDLPEEKEYRYGADVPFEPAATASGYTFSGWSTTFQPAGSTSFTMPARAVTVSGGWTTNLNTPYKVEYYFQNIENDNYAIDDSKTKNLTGETDTKATAAKDTFEGFTLDTSIPGTVDSGTIVGDGSLVLKLYYNRNKYDVVYHYTSDVTGESDLPTTKQYKFEEEVDFEADATAPGYTFNGWETTWVKKSESSYFVMPARDVNVNGSWSAKSDTPYKVEYHFQNIDDDDYSIDDTKTKNLTGTTGTNVSAPKDTFEGFTLDTNIPGTVERGAITGDGKLVLKLFYKRNKYDVVYQYTNTVPGASDLPDTMSYKFGANVPFEADATAPGYTFTKWSTTFQPAGASSFTMPARAVTVSGGWLANANTPYTIEYYFQNINDDDYAKDDSKTKHLTGETGKTATAAIDSFEGFDNTTEPAEAKSSGTITGDGKLVLKLYYNREKYDVVYHYTADVTGETPLPATVQYKYQQNVPFTDDATAPGYTFNGWETTWVKKSESSTFEMPARNVTVNGSWTANSNTRFKVVHWFEQENGEYTNDFILNGETKTCVGHWYTETTDTLATVTVDTYNGYEFVQPGTDPDAPSVITQKIKGDNSTVFDLYYKRVKTYKITYTFADPHPDVTVPSDQVDLTYAKTYAIDSTYKKGDTAYGYTFNGWETRHAGVEVVNDSVTMPARDVVLIGTWVPNANTEYTIKHMVKKLNADEYEPYGAPYTRSGETGTEGYAVPLSNAGFKVNVDMTKAAPENAGHTFQESAGTINRMLGEIEAGADGKGTTVFVYYYDRNEYDVTYEVQGDIPEGVVVPDPTSKEYGSTVTVEDALEAAGYTFSGWTTTDATVENNTFTMPSKAVKFVGSFTASTDTPYKVEYYFENIDDDEYSIDDSKTKNLTGTTGTIVNAPQLSGDDLVGFKLNASHQEAKPSGEITGDGKLVLKLYYSRNKFNVIYHFTGKIPQGIEEPAQETYKVGKEVTVQPLPVDTLEDYILVTTGEWEKVQGSDLDIKNHKFIMPNRDVNLSAKWAEDFNHTGKDDSTEKYTVLYKKGDQGTFAEDVVNATKFENLALDATIPAYAGAKDAHDKPQGNEGYTFREWNPSSDTVKANLCVEGTTTIILTAEWAEDKNNNGKPDDEEDFTVLYKRGDHGTFTEDVEDATKFTNLGTGDAAPGYAGETDAFGKPKGEDGYTFKEWQPSNETVKAEDADADSNVNYVAVWSEDKNNNGTPDEDEYRTITYKDGKDGASFQDEVHDKALDGLATPAFESGTDGKPTLKDYVFDKWDPEVAPTVDGDATYTATWKDDKNNNGIPDDEETFKVLFKDTDGSVIEEIDDLGLDDTVTPPEPTKQKYLFNSWTPEFHDTVKAEDANKDSEIVYTAVWDEDMNENGIPDKDEKKYITYDPNGGTFRGGSAPKNIEYHYNQTITIAEAPTRAGYRFLYWKGSEYQPGDKYTVLDDHKFVAQWEKVNTRPNKYVEPTNPNPNAVGVPYTGDDFHVWTWVLQLLISMLVALGARRTLKKYSN